MSLKTLPLLVGMLLLTSAVTAQQAVSMDRETMMGMKSYYIPGMVEAKDKGFAFTLYRTAAPTAGDEVGHYILNCETRNVVATIKGQASPPFRVLPGEELFVVGKKLCEWDEKGFFKKLLD